MQHVWTYADQLQTCYSIWQLLRWPPNARLHGYCCAEMLGMHGSPHDQRLVLQVPSSAQEVSCSITERISSLTTDGVCSEAEPRRRRHREEHSRLIQMIDELNILLYNVGRRKHAQWSIFNDPGLQDFTALAILGPHIYEDPDERKPRTDQHGQWYAMIPSKHRAEVRTRHVFRAMLYFNISMHARQIPVDNSDIVAAIIALGAKTDLIIAIYGPGSQPHVNDRELALQAKLDQVRELVDTAKRDVGDSLQIILCTDLNCHAVLWGRIAVSAHSRRDQGTQVVNLAQEYGLQSLLTAGTITW
jgi:hypothetical protein